MALGFLSTADISASTARIGILRILLPLYMFPDTGIIVDFFTVGLLSGRRGMCRSCAVLFIFFLYNKESTGMNGPGCHTSRG